jgi:hypothetical protein
MPKALCIVGMVIAVLIFILFTLDLLLGFPFSYASPLMDISFVLCSVALGYMSLSAFWETV